MPVIVPIPGATTVDHGIENGKAREVELNEEAFTEIDQMLATREVAGVRRSDEGCNLSPAAKP